MKQNWAKNELAEFFKINSAKLKIIEKKIDNSNNPIFVLFFKFFQNEFRFSINKFEIPKPIINYISEKLNIKEEHYFEYDWNNRTYIFHISKIREFFDFREFNLSNFEQIRDWIVKNILIHEYNAIYIKSKFYERLKEVKIEPLKIATINKLINSALRIYEDNFFNSTFNKLSKEDLSKIDNLLKNEYEQYYSTIQELKEIDLKDNYLKTYLIKYSKNKVKEFFMNLTELKDIHQI